MRSLLVIFVILLTCPSNVKGQAVTDTLSNEQDYATIHFYRKPKFYSGRFACWVDEVRLVSRFRVASYFSLRLPAGTYEIRTNGRPEWIIYEKKYQLKVEAGQDHYIEAVIDYDFLGTALLLVERTETDFNQLKPKLKFDERAKRQMD